MKQIIELAAAMNVDPKTLVKHVIDCLAEQGRVYWDQAEKEFAPYPGDANAAEVINFAKSVSKKVSA